MSIDDLKNIIECPSCGYKFDDNETWYDSRISTCSGEESFIKCHSCLEDLLIYCEAQTMFATMTKHEAIFEGVIDEQS